MIKEKVSINTIKRINDLKEKRDAVILAHVYQRKEVQKIADYISAGSTCKGMKKIDLEKVRLSLEKMIYRVHVPEHIESKAKIALVKMMKIENT